MASSDKNKNKNEGTVKGAARGIIDKVMSWVDEKANSSIASTDAVAMLEMQHLMVRRLFAKIFNTDDASERAELFEDLMTSLAIHTEIEEKVFYPALKEMATTDLLFEATEEHLVVKRLLADLMSMRPTDERWMAKMKVLRENVEHHAREEERGMFPRALVKMDADTRMALAQEMTAVAVDLLEGKEEDVRSSVLNHTDEAAPI